jgi:hypothetical protein
LTLKKLSEPIGLYSVLLEFPNMQEAVIGEDAADAIASSNET